MSNHPLLHEIRKAVDGRSSNQQLEAWLLSHLQGILSSNDQGAIALANELDAMFVDLGEDLITSDEFLDQLAAMLHREHTTYRVVVGKPTITLVGQRTIHKRAEAMGPVTTLRQEVHVGS